MDQCSIWWCNYFITEFQKVLCYIEYNFLEKKVLQIYLKANVNMINFIKDLFQFTNCIGIPNTAYIDLFSLGQHTSTDKNGSDEILNILDIHPNKMISVYLVYLGLAVLLSNTILYTKMQRQCIPWPPKYRFYKYHKQSMHYWDYLAL